MDQKLIKELNQELEWRKERLEKELVSFAHKDPVMKGDYDTDFPDFNAQSSDESAMEVETYENTLPIEYALEKRLLDVNEALEKITKETYGVCDNCRQEMDAKRLRAMPEAKLCVKCQK